MDDPNVLTINDDTIKRKESDENIDPSIFTKRASHFLFKPMAFISALGRSNENGTPYVPERQSFGRRHHWDTYFGRRR